MTSQPLTLNLVQHHPAEGPGEIARWADERGVSLVIYRADLGQLPTINSAPVVLLGGPYESNAGPAWLQTEKEWLAASLALDAPVFAICLGAQLLALSQGATVARMPSTETGWTAIQFDNGQSLDVLEWHEDSFSLPPGATRHAVSEACKQQMFSLGPRRIGLQFHPEWNAESVILLNQHFAEESPLPRGLDPQQIEAHAHVARWLRTTLDGWWSAACVD
ncbi:type 1 glutamine amidotransferase [Pseudomonas sp. NA-150]|uniref:type 1 glutamine amidotransferase n=1 Tax=Pseudomonas sp. NA-150 TaxID=3367525 RepID=UPI0037C97759